MKKTFWTTGFALMLSLGLSCAPSPEEASGDLADILAAYTGPQIFSLRPETFVEEYNAHLVEIGETRYARFQEYAEKLTSTLEEEGWHEAFQASYDDFDVLLEWFTGDRWDEARAFRDKVLALESLPKGFSITEKIEGDFDFDNMPFFLPQLREIARYLAAAASVAEAREMPEETSLFVECGLFLGADLFQPINFIDQLTLFAITGVALEAFWDTGWETWPSDEEGAEWIYLSEKSAPKEKFIDALSLELLVLFSYLEKFTEIGQRPYSELEHFLDLFVIVTSHSDNDSENIHELYFKQGVWREDVKYLLSRYSDFVILFQGDEAVREENIDKWKDEAMKGVDEMYLISTQFINMLGRFGKTYLRHVRDIRLAALASAIRIYYENNGHLPESLASLPLVEEDPEWGLSPFTGEPIQYKMEGPGFSLYLEAPGMSQTVQDRLRREVTLPGNP